MLASGSLATASPQQCVLQTPDRHDASDNAAYSNPGASNVVVVVVVNVVDEMLVVVVVVVGGLLRRLRTVRIGCRRMKVLQTLRRMTLKLAR